MNEKTVRIVRGTNRTIKILVQDVNGAPFDITGATGYLTVKLRKDDDSNTFQKVTSTPAQGSIPNGTDGVIEFYLVAADTADLDPDAYVYDVQVVLADTKRYAVVGMSPFEVTWDVG